MATIRVPDLSKFEWQKSCKDKDILTPPGSPAAGDRYLIKGVGTGAWTGKDNQIATWTGTVWEYTLPIEGMKVWVADEDATYLYITTWAIEAAGHAQQHAITSTADHTSTATSGKMLKADTNGLPIDATNTDTEVADAVAKKATLNAGLGTIDFEL